MTQVDDSSGVDLRPPDSRFARETEELIGEVAPPFLRNHSLRSHAWAVALARLEDVRFDAELLYVAALLHDLGLIKRYDTGRCFEEDGAQAAATLAAHRGWSSDRREALAEAIRLHMAVDITLGTGAETYLLWHSTGVDVTGHRFEEIPPTVAEAVLAAYPRLDFKQGFTALFRDQAERKPGCRAAAMTQGGMEDRISRAPFES